ncbi:hypothetical protein ACQW02_25485 [Humitalea sp. 24SJ18S-53]|uniref:hypothetical protein n=1 Tax=Humitalea sp. 24SJ18S-53 TaxID=3422307 RepID=UPI003D676E82
MSTATLETVRAAIGAIMQAVPGIGIVHPYERYAATEPRFASLYMWQPPEYDRKPELRGWFIRRVGHRETAYRSTANELSIDWQLRGYMAIQDALQSEITMDNLVEQLRFAILADVTLGGLLDVPLPQDAPLGAQLVESGPYMFAGVLCHGVRLDWTTSYQRDLRDDLSAAGDFRIFHANWDIPPHGNVQPPLPADATADATDHVLIPE